MLRMITWGCPVRPYRYTPPLQGTLNSSFRIITSPSLNSWWRSKWKAKISPACLRPLEFGSPAYALGLVRILALEMHPKKNSSRERKKSLSTDSQHTKHFPPASTTGLQRWKFGSRKPLSTVGLKTHMCSKWESQNPSTVTLAPIKHLLDPSIGWGVVLDSISVAISMINKGNRNNFIALALFTFSRVDSSRWGKHAFIWYYEGTYDPYFQAPNLYWSIIKQTHC